MPRLFALFVLLLAAGGCCLNRSFTPISPSQFLGSEHSRKGIAALERGDLTEAEKRLEDAIKYNKNDINHRRYYAEVLWQQGKHQESLQQLSEAVQRGGQSDASLHLSLAAKCLAIRDYTSAYRYADEAVRLDSRDAQSWALRGRTMRLQAIQMAGHAEEVSKMFHQSREDYLRAVSLSPNDRELLAELAAVQMDCGQPERAWATWLSLQNMYPQGGEPAEVLLGKTETLMALQRFDEVQSNLLALQQRGSASPEAEQRWQRMFMAVQDHVRR